MPEIPLPTGTRSSRRSARRTWKASSPGSTSPRRRATAIAGTSTRCGALPRSAVGRRRRSPGIRKERRPSRGRPASWPPGRRPHCWRNRRTTTSFAFHCLGLFAGLRVAEIKALDWQDVDLAGGFIHVGAKISKTRARRLVPVLPNLKAWLQPIAKPAGPVVERELRYRHEAAWGAIEIKPAYCE
jgi:Phage integrase family